MDEYGWRTVFHWDTFIVVLFLYLQVQLPEIWTCGSSLAECSGPNSDSKVTLSQENLRRWLLFSCRHWSLVITRSQSILLSEDSWLGSCSIAQLGSCTNKQSICGRLHRSRQKKKKKYDWTAVKRSNLASSEPELTHGHLQSRVWFWMWFISAGGGRRPRNRPQL